MTATVNNTAGIRFINAYNAIDHALRTQYNFKSNISFTDLIRRCSVLNTVIHTYEDDLLALARLRNAIVHSKSEEIIAEPHDDIVELTEKIARIITTPPLAVEALKHRGKVVTVSSAMTLRDIIIETNRVKYSNLPVYKNNALIGVVNWKKFIENLGSILVAKEQKIDDFVNNTTVEEFLRRVPSNSHFALASAKITIEEVLRMFNRNRKLASIIITPSGNHTENAMAIITGADVMSLMTVLENF